MITAQRPDPEAPKPRFSEDGVDWTISKSTTTGDMQVDSRGKIAYMDMTRGTSLVIRGLPTPTPVIGKMVIDLPLGVEWYYDESTDTYRIRFT